MKTNNDLMMHEITDKDLYGVNQPNACASKIINFKFQNKGERNKDTAQITIGVFNSTREISVIRTALVSDHMNASGSNQFKPKRANIIDI